MIKKRIKDKFNLNKDKVKKAILYLILLAVDLLIMVLEFVFLLFDGVIGFLICLAAIYLIIGSVIKLCRLAADPAGTFIGLLDLLFWLP